MPEEIEFDLDIKEPAIAQTHNSVVTVIMHKLKHIEKN